MELHELGLSLALPVHNPVKGFDLNSHGVERKDMMMGLETWSYACSLERKNKRRFDVAFEKSTSTAAGNESKMLNLLSWNGQPNEADDGNGQKRRDSCSITKNDDGGNHVVGWPPIKSWRKKMLYQRHGYEHDHNPLQNQRLAHKENENDEIPANSMYVKVKMEGVGIVRKIDIKLHHSYQTLKDTLITMFPISNRCEKEGGAGAGPGADYILTFQDKRGDWLLAADVPWQSFIESAQRLQILRNGG